MTYRNRQAETNRNCAVFVTFLQILRFYNVDNLTAVNRNG